MSKNKVLDAAVVVDLFESGLGADLVREVWNSASSPSEGIRTLLDIWPEEKPNWLKAVGISAFENEGRKILVVLRGLPGSGKSSMAELLRLTYGDDKVVVSSADDFFVDENGVYDFMPQLLSQAHEWAQNKVKKAIKGYKTKTGQIMRPRIIVSDNTNTHCWQIQPYLQMAKEGGATVLLLAPEMATGDPVTLACRTKHGVPLDKIQLLKTRYEPGIATTRALLEKAIPDASQRPEYLEIDHLLTEALKKPAMFESKAKKAAVQKPNPIPEMNGLSFKKPKAPPNPNPAMDLSTDSGSNSSSASASENIEFQSLLQCFPELKVEEIYPLYIEARGDVNRCVQLILEYEATKQPSPRILPDSPNSLLPSSPSPPSSSSSSTENDEFQSILTLDSEFASKLELSFGKVRTDSFPGCTEVRLPTALARLIHSYWRQEYDAKQAQNLADKENDSTHNTLAERVKSRMLSNHSPSRNSRIQDEDQQQRYIPLRTDPHSNVNQSYSPYWNQGPDDGDLASLKARRAELYSKAFASFKARQGGVAAYYSEEARKLNDRIHGRYADARYAKFEEWLTKNESTTSLDLHGMSVEEAFEHVDWFVTFKHQQLLSGESSTATRRLEIVTGKGNSSRGGSAKIKPAVIKYLETERGLKAKEGDNPGAIEVVIKKSDKIM